MTDTQKDIIIELAPKMQNTGVIIITDIVTEDVIEECLSEAIDK